MIRAWLMVMAVVLAGCSYVQQFKPRDTSAQGPQLVVEFEGGGVAVYELNMSRPEMVYPFIRKVDEGFYDGLYVHRVVPGLFVQTGEGSWLRRAPWAITAPQKEGRAAHLGEIGLVENPNGTYGPYLNMMFGGTDVETSLVPQTLVLGWLVDGASAVKSLKKGDKIFRIYGRGFGAAREPARRDGQ
ncbi:MAG: peptidylprolyl isomerase [Alphaproteobacteria bacterium]